MCQPVQHPLVDVRPMRAYAERRMLAFARDVPSCSRRAMSRAVTGRPLDTAAGPYDANRASAGPGYKAPGLGAARASDRCCSEILIDVQ